jgi:hypothetical protein
MPEYWYDHAELVAEVNSGRRTQPEFDPRSDLDDEEIRIVNDVVEPDGTTAAVVDRVNEINAIVEAM